MAVRAAHISEILAPGQAEQEPDKSAWHPVRAHFGIASFGASAYVARAAGDRLVGEHTETDTRHEELYYVAVGRAHFTVDGEDVAAPAGTFVYVRDPGATRTAVAEEPGTTVFCVGGEPGVAFAVSAWEQEYLDAGPAAARG